MRPDSIVMFERLFLASLTLGVLAFFLTYDAIMTVLAVEPGFRQAGLGGGFVIGLFAVFYAICVLLWYLVAHKASNVAKWILVVLTVLDVLAGLPALTGSWSAMLLLSLGVRVLEVAAVVYLFRTDAVTWLKGKEVVDTVTDTTVDAGGSD